MPAEELSQHTVDTVVPADAVVRRSWLHALPWIGFTLSVLALIAALLAWLQQSSLHRSLAEQTRRSAMLQTVYQNEAVRVRDLEAGMTAVQKADSRQELLLQSYQKRISRMEASQGLDRSQGFLVNMAGSVRMAEQHSALTGKKQPVMQALERVEQELNALPEEAQVQLLAAVRQDVSQLEAQPVDSYRVSLRITTMLNNAPDVQWLSSVPQSGSVTAGESVADAGADTDTAIVPAPVAERGQDTDSADGAETADAANSEEQTLTERWTRLADAGWWQQQWDALSGELLALVRVSHLEQPGAAMLTPRMNRYVQTEYRLLLMQARISVMSQDYAGAGRVLEQAQELLRTYADTGHAGSRPAMEQLTRTVGDLQMLRPVTAQATSQAFRRLLQQQARSE